ncbi:potassium voltage-gated channel protein Shaw-like [Mytilus trossulus]|uniref:potassium voltage-gated channel protein Shaw-like n=1 Tax=Mytilus trossulus TaxID=6551 RepID=UPI0030059302
MSGEIHINVGGTLFETKWSTLQRHCDTLLGSLTTTSEYYNKDKKQFFFDRNPELFNTILDFYRNGELHFPTHICGWNWKQELEFWRISVTDISECCYPKYIKYEKDQNLVNYIKNAFIVRTAEYQTHKVSCLAGIKQRIWLFLEEPTSSIAAKIFSIFYLLIVLLSAITPMLVTHPDLRQKHVDLDKLIYWVNLNGLNLWIDKENPKEVMFVTTVPPKWLKDLDLFITMFFSCEQISRFASCPRKKEFFKDWLNVLDIILFFAMWTIFIIDQSFDEKLLENYELLIFYSVCYCLVVFRLFRFFRITKQYSALRILLMSVKSSMKELGLLSITFLIFVLLFANLIYFAELRDPTTFPDMVIGIWWTVVTMTTVGYGDEVPKTALGRTVGSLCAVSGLLIIAMPIAVIAGKFNDLYEKNANREDFQKLHTIQKIGKVHPSNIMTLKQSLKNTHHLNTREMKSNADNKIFDVDM